MNDNLACSGCGVSLQTENKTNIGYIPVQAVNNDPLLCQRCFQLRHYNKNESVSMTESDFFEMISSIREQNGVVLHVIDLFDVEGSILKNLPRIVGAKKIVLVANKIDLLPKSMNHQKVKHWLFRMAKELNLSIENVFLISAKKGHGVNEVADYLQSIRNKQDIYIVGVTNAGKSTFINYLIQNSTDVKDAITTSYFPGTTLGFIHIPLDDTSGIIDTPGIVNKQQISHYVSKSDLKKITPAKEVKARNYQLNDGQTLFFGGLARFDFIKGDRQTFVCYFSNELPIHRTKIDNAQELYERQLGNILSPPNEETIKHLPELIKQSYRIKQANTDIVFSGLGWVTILKGNVTIDVYYPKGAAVTIRQSF